MAKFAYRMQSILDIKEKMEGQAKIAYGVANAKLMDEQGKLQQIMIRKAGYESQARNLVNGTIDVPKIKEWQAGSRYHENDAAQPDDECACRRKKCRGCPVETQ